MRNVLLTTFIIVSLFLVSGCVKDFQDFGNLPRMEKSTLYEAIQTKEYGERLFYNVFNELTWEGTRPDPQCVANKETYECIYFYGILNNKESLCRRFPVEREIKSCSRQGCYNQTVYYRDSCILYTRIYQEYEKSGDKLSFCNSFNEEYIWEACVKYTCLSLYFEHPEECRGFDLVKPRED